MYTTRKTAANGSGEHQVISAFIFDLDGTLLDSEVLWVEATEAFMRQHDPDVSREHVVSIVYGKSWHGVYSDICAHLTELNMTLPQMQEALKPYFQRLATTRDIRIQGSIDLLRRLSTRYPVCIVSGSSREDIRDGIALMGIADHLQFFLGAEDYSPGKPDPTCFLSAAQRLHVPPSECLVFEDSAAGVCAAKRAGMYCVALLRPDRPPQDVSGADLTIDDLGRFDLDAFTTAASLET